MGGLAHVPLETVPRLVAAKRFSTGIGSTRSAEWGTAASNLS